MRVKISGVNLPNLKNINIQEVEFLDKYDEGLPKIYFKCHKRYEELFFGKLIIFHDSKGRELFRSSLIRAEFRYYESDSRENKVKFSANAIELEELGLVSKPYLRKILRQCCNAKVASLPKKEEPPLRRDLKSWSANLRFMDIVKSRLRKAPIYKYKRIFRYICNKICPKLLITKQESNAPT